VDSLEIMQAPKPSSCWNGAASGKAAYGPAAGSEGSERGKGTEGSNRKQAGGVPFVSTWDGGPGAPAEQSSEPDDRTVASVAAVARVKYCASRRQPDDLAQANATARLVLRASDSFPQVWMLQTARSEQHARRRARGATAFTANRLAPAALASRHFASAPRRGTAPEARSNSRDR